MATAQPAASSELLSERIAGGILPRVLNSFDMVAIQVQGLLITGFILVCSGCAR